MTEEFVAVLKKLITDHSVVVLGNAKRCHSLLMDYGSEHEREIKLFVKALEKDFPEKVCKSSDRAAEKKLLAEIWHRDDFIDIDCAKKMLNCLCHVLFNDPLSDKVEVLPNIDVPKVIEPPVKKVIAKAEPIVKVEPKEPKNTFTDKRDGKVYRIVKICNQVWMAENLNFNAPGSKCYENDPKNGEKYGRLYDWNTAMKVCPPGWHLPNKDEWEALSGFVGGSDIEGKHLKAKEGWNVGGSGQDTYGFAALPGGYGFSSDGSFLNIGHFGCWWVASEDKNGAYSRRMYYSFESAGWSNYDRKYLFSVRCLQD